jgi:hypothetical protein
MMLGALLHLQQLRRNYDYSRRSREWEQDLQSDSVVAERVVDGLPRSSADGNGSDEDVDSVIINMMTTVCC